MKDLGTLIKSIRKDKNLSLRDLAEKSKSSPSYLSLIEQNKRTPQPEVLRRISDVLGETENEITDIYNSLMKSAGYIDDEVFIYSFSEHESEILLKKDINKLGLTIGDLQRQLHEAKTQINLTLVADGSSTGYIDGMPLTNHELQSIKMIIEGIKANRKRGE